MISDTVREYLRAGRIDDACQQFAREKGPVDMPSSEALEAMFACDVCSGSCEVDCTCGIDDCDGKQACWSCEGLGLAPVGEAMVLEAMELAKKLPRGGQHLRICVLRAYAHGLVDVYNVQKVARAALGMEVRG